MRAILECAVSIKRRSRNEMFDWFGAVSQLAKLGLSLNAHGAKNFKDRSTIYFEVR